MEKVRTPRRMSSVRSLSKNFFAQGGEPTVRRSVPESECKGRDFLNNGKTFRGLFSKKTANRRKRDNAEVTRNEKREEKGGFNLNQKIVNKERISSIENTDEPFYRRSVQDGMRSLTGYLDEQQQYVRPLRQVPCMYLIHYLYMGHG